jgi:GH15 family glucan-1,4-alpha-glucosidase
MLSLKDYSLIGNSRAAALVSKHGSIDWCCLPEFHAPALFSAILDQNKGGLFSISPVETYQSLQQYVPKTNVLQTVFKTGTGELTLTDAFVASTEEEKKQALFPDHEILRILRCTGQVRIRMQFEPTLFYGRSRPVLTIHNKIGIKFSSKENVYFLRSSLSEGTIKASKNKAFATFELREGEEAIFSFSCSSQSPAIVPELSSTGNGRMTGTIHFWQNWSAQCSYEGIYKEQVIRSALVLKLLAHAPSGSIIAAPTTSLPEEIGGERNWDYRYCWLRDASFTVRALLKLGFELEARAYMNWILHATRLTQPNLQIVYSVYGQARLKEQELPWLSGFKNSTPVRIGNGAYNQYQLDVYGEVLDAFFSYSGIIEAFDRETQKFLLGLGDVICKLWDIPDNGIWEMRSFPQHHTHSKVMAWVGLDRLIALIEKYKWKATNPGRYKTTKAAIEKQITTRGYNSKLQCYTSTLDGNSIDASSLIFSLVRFCEASSKEMTSTVEQIREHLSKNKLIFRYRGTDDGIQGGEGCFGICNFWLAENLAKSGRVKEAIDIFEAVLNTASPTGLLSEEMDPTTNEPLGNYPQGFTHIGLINAALSINEAQKKGAT